MHNLDEIWDILAEVKVKLENHLHHHESITKHFLAPILVGIIISIILILVKR